ncbi:MAG: hypothetical protein HYZ11_09305 [Candidatus Tectomicrobia bacterium]|uniref:CBS domain-containing protein n=1 Tax=Tectimicrobiota bacterium TaxID=2528274 RepID=A0A932I102_UNCTE|nr:hypothetical protein [Candidatus Tectomicrobia bacterium]
MKLRETFLQAVVLVQAEDDAREAWLAMNRKNAPWVAVFEGVRPEGGRLVGLLDGRDLEGALAPEVFVTAGDLAAGERPSRRAIRLSPDGELEEALAQLGLAGADAGFVEGRGRPPGVLVR